MSSKHLPTIEYLRQRFSYNDGKLFWLPRSREHFSDDIYWKAWNTKHTGKEAGHLRERRRPDWVDHRWIINLDKRLYRRSRLVWVFHGGSWGGLIDHENRQEFDDRIENLRLASDSQNQANARKPKSNTSGFKGVTFDRLRNKWKAQIKVNYKGLCLGRFATPEQAFAAYCEAARKHFGEFACDGERSLT